MTSINESICLTFNLKKTFPLNIQPTTSISSTVQSNNSFQQYTTNPIPASIYGSWSEWYTKDCFIQKRRVLNGSIQYVNITITNLQLCDFLSGILSILLFLLWALNLIS